MVFNSLQYLVFFPLVFAVYWQLKRRGQNVLLLLASWFFYAMWDWRFLGLMLLTTGVDFGVGRYLAMTEDDKKRKLAFGLSLGLNLTVLGFFKYFNFFVGSAADLLQTFGLDASEPTLRVLLPVGISFYTFHGISYTFDVFRRDIEPADDLLDFAVFVAFFPQLVAGPIGRAHLQLPQFEHERPPLRWEQARSGLCLILLGLFKKVAIADALAPFVDRTFTEPGRASWISLLGGAYAFALQIYGDFAGYSDVARGSSRLLGIELPLNFEQPYLSRNITVFWRTWHISLSNWLRDYLYIPLGGNRGSRAKTYRNLMLTMVLGGLWHGAAWTFVAWGTLQRPVPLRPPMVHRTTGRCGRRPQRHRPLHLERRAPGHRHLPARRVRLDLLPVGQLRRGVRRDHRDPDPAGWGHRVGIALPGRRARDRHHRHRHRPTEHRHPHADARPPPRPPGRALRRLRGGHRPVLGRGHRPLHLLPVLGRRPDRGRSASTMVTLSEITRGA